MSLGLPSSELISAAEEILKAHEKQKEATRQEEIDQANELVKETKAMVRGISKLQQTIEQAKTAGKEFPIVKDAQHALEKFLMPLTQAKETLETATAEKNRTRDTLSQLKREIPDSDLIPKLEAALAELVKKEKSLKEEYKTLHDQYHRKEGASAYSVSVSSPHHPDRVYEGAPSVADLKKAELENWHTPVDIAKFTATEIHKLYPDPVFLKEGEPVRMVGNDARRISKEYFEIDAIQNIAQEEVMSAEKDATLHDLKNLKNEWVERMKLLKANEDKYINELNEIKNLVSEFKSKQDRLLSKVFRVVTQYFLSTEQFKREISTKLEGSKKSYQTNFETIWREELEPLFQIVMDTPAKLEMKRSYPAYYSYAKDFHKYQASSGEARYGEIRFAVDEERDAIREEFHRKRNIYNQHNVRALEDIVLMDLHLL